MAYYPDVIRGDELLGLLLAKGLVSESDVSKFLDVVYGRVGRPDISGCRMRLEKKGVRPCTNKLGK